jgi:hypothetical protein
MAKTHKGHIQRLPSGSFRVKVYAGTDPVTAKERLLRQTCPDEASAYIALGRLLAEADGGRFPDRHATVGQALDKYLEVADLEVSTREAHQGYVRRTIGPVLGESRSVSLAPTPSTRCTRKYSEIVWSPGASAQVSPWMPGWEPQYFRIVTCTPR